MKKLASRKDTRVIDLMIAFGPLGYGIYALLVEYLKERKAFRSVDDIERIAYELHADAETLRAVITDFNLFEIIDGVITHKVPERKVPAPVAEKSELPENSEYSENSEMPFAAPSDDEASPASKPVTSSLKRRERRRRLRLMGMKTP